MSGHGFQKIEGMRFALGKKGFISSPLSNEVTQFYSLSSSPFWNAKHRELYRYTHIELMDWQSNTKTVTWTFDARGRYTPPTNDETFSSGIPPTYLYSSGKRSKQHSEFIVGGAYWSNTINRYLAVTIDQEYESTLKLWSTQRLAPYTSPQQATDWELISTLGTLGADEKLNTSVFFNQDANEAVAVVTDLVTVDGTAPGNRRLRIFVTINSSNELQSSMEIEDAYPGTFTTVVSATTLESTTCGGTTLIASDYQVLRNAETKDELVDLVVTIDFTDQSSFFYEAYEVEGEYAYSRLRTSSTFNYEYVTKIIKTDQSWIEVITSSGSGSANWGGPWPDNTIRSNNASHSKNRMFDMDLRTLTFLIESDSYSSSSSSIEVNPGFFKQTTVHSLEEKQYTIIRYSSSSFEEENQWLVSIARDDEEVLYNFEDLYVTNYFGQFVGSSDTWYVPYGNLDQENFFLVWLNGQLKSLILKNDVYYFLSGKYEDLYMVDLENGDPVELSGFNLQLFNALSVI